MVLLTTVLQKLVILSFEVGVPDVVLLLGEYVGPRVDQWSVVGRLELINLHEVQVQVLDSMQTSPISSSILDVTVY